MKKLLSVFLLIFTFAFVGCTENITYSEKFDYLPILSGSELVNFEEGKDSAPDKAEYKLEKTTAEEAASDYENLLTKNGWALSEEESEGDTYKYTKDEHWVIIFFDEDGEDAKFTIVSN